MARHSAPTSASGWITPISLCAAITETDEGALGQRRGEPVERDQSILLDIEVGHGEALALQRRGAFEDAFVLGREDDDVVAR